MTRLKKASHFDVDFKSAYCWFSCLTKTEPKPKYNHHPYFCFLTDKPIYETIQKVNQLNICSDFIFHDKIIGAEYFDENTNMTMMPSSKQFEVNCHSTNLTWAL